MTSFAGIGTEPFTGTYTRARITHVEGNGTVGDGALKTPLDLGPGWYRGFPVYYEPFDKDKIMPTSSGSIANVYGPPRAILPVKPPVAGTRDPHGPVYAATYIPPGLPVIMPSKGWHIGPQVENELALGAVVGDRLEGLQSYQRLESQDQRNYGMGPLSEPLIVAEMPVAQPLIAPIQPYMTPANGYGSAVLETLDATPYWAVSAASLLGSVLTWDAGKRLFRGGKTTTAEKIAVIASAALSGYSLYRLLKK